MNVFNLALVFLFTASSVVFAEKINVKGVRLADIHNYSPDEFLYAKLLEARMKKYPVFYYGDPNSKSHMNFIVEAPVRELDGKITLTVGSIVEQAEGNTVEASKWGGSVADMYDTADDDNQHEVQLNTIRFNPNSKHIDFEIINKEIVDINNTRFELKIGLKERRLILKDQLNEKLEIVMPVGVGALDLGVSKSDTFQLMTPLYEKQNIDTNLNQVSWAHRDDKSYYKGKPFIRFKKNTNEYGGWSTIGLHIQQNKKFKRAFDSHGCMRLRPEDLDAVFRILMNTESTDGLVLADILLELDKEDIDHPMPKINDKVKIVKNFGSKQNPETGKDRHGLTATESRVLTKVEYMEIWRRIEGDYSQGKISVEKE